MKKKISALLVAVLILSVLSGCGKKEEEAYSSPSFSNGSKTDADASEEEDEDASLTDALLIASYSDATVSDASEVDELTATLTDAPLMGVRTEKVYYNTLAEFKITLDTEGWEFYDAAEVATATDSTTDYINNLWYGYTSPYDEGTTYAAIAYHKESGSSIIVSYVNPTEYNMPDYSAREYLEMAAGKYEGLKVRTATFVGDKYEILDVPDEQSNVGRRTQFAIKKEGLIVVVTITTNNDYKLEDAVRFISPLYY